MDVLTNEWPLLLYLRSTPSPDSMYEADLSPGGANSNGRGEETQPLFGGNLQPNSSARGNPYLLLEASCEYLRRHSLPNCKDYSQRGSFALIRYVPLQPLHEMYVCMHAWVGDQGSWGLPRADVAAKHYDTSERIHLHPNIQTGQRHHLRNQHGAARKTRRRDREYHLS